MKRFLLLVLIFAGCSKTDTTDGGPEINLVDPVINISNFESMLVEGDMVQFDAELLDDTGMIDNVSRIAWSSSDENVLSVSSTGLVTALGGGQANVIVTGLGVSDEVAVTVEAAVNPSQTGSLMGIAGYTVTGNFNLERNDADDVILTVRDYTHDGPGPYFYLSNDTQSVTNAVALGNAEPSGNYDINVTAINDTVKLGSFNYLVVWCEPFEVTLGYGEFGE